MAFLFAFLVALAMAQNDTASYGTAADGHVLNSTTVDLLILDGAWPGFANYAASLVEACADRAVYAVNCTSAPNETIPSGATIGYPPHSGNWNDMGNVLGPIPQMCNWEPGRVRML